MEDYPWCNDKDVVMKKSKDGGKTWSELEVLLETDTDHFYSNPTPVYDPLADQFVMVKKKEERRNEEN